jgi:hypothetical protein
VAGDSAGLSGDYLEGLIFYSLLAAALVVISDIASPLLGVPGISAFVSKPLAVYACAYLAARDSCGSAVVSGFTVGVLSATLYEITALTGFWVIFGFRVAPGYRQYLVAVIASCMIAGVAAGVLAASLRARR